MVVVAQPKSEVHKLAQAGFGTGTNELYDRARPSYQPEALQLLRESVPVQSGLNIVEIGSGTGIFTRALLAHPAWRDSIASLRAVEPSEGMRDQFSKTVIDERISVHDGAFDHTGAPDGSADLIIIAQAFHWCPDFDSAVQEFGRVLKPGGVVALIWNLEDRDRGKWVGTVRDIYEAHEQGTPQFRLGLWKAVFEVPSYDKVFEPHQIEVFHRAIPTTVEGVQDRVRSKSYIAILGDEEKAKVRDGVNKVFEGETDRVWIDKEKGVFEYPYQTVLVLMRKK